MIARKVLWIPATSASSKRLLSFAGRAITNERRTLGSGVARSLIYLRVNQCWCRLVQHFSRRHSDAQQEDMMQFSLLLPLLILPLLLHNVIFVKSQKLLYTMQFGSKGDDVAQAIAVRRSPPSSVVVTLAGELGGHLRFKKKENSYSCHLPSPRLLIPV
eukprot:scaffold4296_cov157-Ochromonas_danica.AAC.3